MPSATVIWLPPAAIHPGELAAADQQTRQALTNCEAIFRAGGASLDDVIEVGILLTPKSTAPAMATGRRSR
jgi:enamine deaminase RidA (YjgF/YER057c/UK114 family)